MPVQIPPFMSGRNVSLCGVNGAVASAFGVLTPDSFYDLRALGVFDSWEYQASLQSTDNHSGNATIANYVPDFDDFTITITEIRQADGTSYLENHFFNYLYMRMAAQATALAYGAGSNVPGNFFVAFGIRGEISGGGQEGKNVVTVTLKPCGVPPYLGPTPPF
jgi:hypothetical protein